MRELIDGVRAWSDAGVGAGRAVVVRTFGSAPRPEGANLVVADDGRVLGSVSGGCVEGAAAEEVARARRDGMARVIRYGISDAEAWDVGLACGGTIDVLIEPALRPEILAAAASGAGQAVAILLPPDAPPELLAPHRTGDGAPPGPALVVDPTGTLLAGGLGDAAADAAVARVAAAALAEGRSTVAIVAVGGEQRQVFVEAFEPRPRLVVVGAVQVAIPLVAIARTLGYATVVVDGRAAFLTRERFPDADRLELAWPDDAADAIGLGPDDALAVLTHDPKFDEPAIVLGLARGCRYVGAVGSRRTQAARRARLESAGVPPSDLDRVAGPIGLDLGGRSPEETALSIMAEVVAERHGGSGRPLHALATEARGTAVGREAAVPGAGTPGGVP
ncbi:MAG: XdhC family protein [Chloroflexi bacterium]|nr:XdhC family protein [Chloroflexota bacterium]